MSVYFDANATEPLREAVITAMLSAAKLDGNPMSVHQFGRQARQRLEQIRDAIAAHFCLSSQRIVFTSGGTEANNLALTSMGANRRILIGATEHDSIRKASQSATILPVLANGVLCLETLAKQLKQGGPALVCAMAANNETGVLHPLKEISALCAQYDTILHIDAVQMAGRIPFDINERMSVSISGHKFGGPPGAGALIVPEKETVSALIQGGGQERGRRGGTPPLPALAGMAAALDEAIQQDWGKIERLRERIERGVCALGAEIIGWPLTPRLPNTSSIRLPNVAAQLQVISLDLAGVAVSSGAACSSGKTAPSHVLLAMGLGQGAAQAIRVSLPWNAEDQDVDTFLAAYQDMAQRLRERS